jgi:GT2 family glycosyltransferase
MTRASIIIPTCDRCADLNRCVGILRMQLPTDSNVRVIVCDDGKGDESRKMLAAEFPEVEWRQGPRKGPPANRNFGAKVADSEWLIYIDDDCVPRAGYLNAYLDAFETAGPRGLFHGLTFPVPALNSMFYEAPSVTEPQKIFPSCNFAIRKQLFDETGGFDERYFSAFEDIEYFSRLDRLGVKAVCVDNAAVDHPIRRIPNSRKLASRWETRVIYVMDLGATPPEIAILLTKHVLLVIFSRFRKAKFTLENARATLVFAGEFLYFLYLLPGWIRKHANGPRSKFWKEQVALGKAPPRFGL